MLKNAPTTKLDFAKPFVQSARLDLSNLLKVGSQRIAILFVVGAVVLSGCTSAGPFEPHRLFKQAVLPSGYTANPAPVSGFNGGAYNYNVGGFIPQVRFAPLQNQNGFQPLGGFGGRLPSTPFRGAGVFNSGSC